MYTPSCICSSAHISTPQFLTHHHHLSASVCAGMCVSTCAYIRSITIRKSRYDLGKSFFTNITPGYQLYPVVFLINWRDPAAPGAAACQEA